MSIAADVTLDGGIILAVVVQTGALFYWGGSVRQMLKDHDRRIEDHDRRIGKLED